ncbi:MAG TPA: hypothetical protein VF834_02835 [Streptosporangiaceae bacterium]
MSTAPADRACPANLHYPDEQPVRLDVSAIMTRGTRIRRRRLATRVAGAAVAFAVVPGAIVLTRQPTTTLHGTLAAPDTGRRFGQHHPNTLRASSDQATGVRATIQTRVAASATLPQGYDPIISLAGDQSGDGVWFWGESSQLKVYHLSRDGQLKTWSVLPLTESLRVGGAAGFAVTSAGVVWLGLNTTLISLDTRTGQVRSWQIPAPSGNPAAASYGPPGSNASYEVQALAAAPGGDVAVAKVRSSSVQVLDPATGRFHQVMMPSQDDAPVALGFARDGALGVGYQHVGKPNGSGVVVDPVSGPILVRAVTDSTAVAPYGAAGLLVGEGRPEVVSATGAVRPLALPVDPIGLTAFPAPPAPLPGGRLATVVHAGILTFPAGATSVAQVRARSVFYQAPVVRCPPVMPSGAGGPLPSATAYPGPCYLPIQLLATDARGDFWVVGGSGQTVDLLVPR